MRINREWTSPNLEICGMCEYSIRIQTIQDVSQNNANHISHKVRPPSCVSWFRYPHRYISHSPNDNQVISQPGPSHHKSVINPIKSTLLLVKLTCFLCFLSWCQAVPRVIRGHRPGFMDEPHGHVASRGRGLPR